MRPRVVLIDNYDSFTYNLVHALWRSGASVEVYLHDRIDLDALASDPPRGLVLSPGPGTPREAGRTLEAIRRFKHSLPVLGVCLGHQALAVAFGARLESAPELLHGKVSRVSYLPGEPMFQGLPQGCEMARYNSLIVDSATLPPELVACARSDHGELMALRHADLPLWGVQFHPESALSTHGQRLLDNWLLALRR